MAVKMERERGVSGQCMPINSRFINLLYTLRLNQRHFRDIVYSGQIVGEREGTAFTFRLCRGNAVPLAYTIDSYLQHKQQKKMCVKCMI